MLRFVVAISAWIEISKKMSLLFRLPGHPVFSMKNLRCVLWICLYLSDIGFSDIVSWASSMQYNFSSYNCASFCFFSCKWWSKNFLMTSVNRLFFFQFFLPYQLTFDVPLCLLQYFFFEWKYWSQILYMLIEGSVRPWNVSLACID